MKKRTREKSKEDLTRERLSYEAGRERENLTELYDLTYDEQKGLKREEGQPNKWTPTKAVLEKVNATKSQFHTKPTTYNIKNLNYYRQKNKF